MQELLYTLGCHWKYCHAPEILVTHCVIACLNTPWVAGNGPTSRARATRAPWAPAPARVRPREARRSPRAGSTCSRKTETGITLESYSNAKWTNKSAPVRARVVAPRPSPRTPWRRRWRRRARGGSRGSPRPRSRKRPSAGGEPARKPCCRDCQAL